MARAKSDDKRTAILAAATQVVAAEGISAATARIAKIAGVAEGTLFTYFSNKDVLLNQLYLQLKGELRDVMLPSYPKSRSLRSRVKHVWERYLEWGIANPEKRKAVAQLSVCDRVTEETRAAASQAFDDIHTLVEESIASGQLHGHSPAFVSAIMGTLAETTMDFMTRDAQHAERYSASGFTAFWNAITK